MSKSIEALKNLEAPQTPSINIDEEAEIAAKSVFEESPQVKDSLLNSNISDPWKRTLFQRLDHIRAACRDLCGVNDMHEHRKRTKLIEGARFGTISADVNCEALFELDGIDASDLNFPHPPPSELMKYYTLDNAIRFIPRRRWKQGYLGGEARTNVWTKEMIEEQIQMAEKGEPIGTYGTVKAREIQDRLKQLDLAGKSVLVIGSEKPWVEVLSLWAGADSVTTLEYGRIDSQHPRIKTLTPEDFRKKYINGTLGVFDVIASHSSLEHSGLGRYGDALNPWGDILSLARAWCVTKEQGVLLLGLPTGPDGIKWNAHRIYGNIRWPMITTNWVPIDNTTDFNVGLETSGGTVHLFQKN